MSTHLRRGLLALMALLVGLFVAGPASASTFAAPSPSPTACETARPGYAAPGVCQLVAHVSVACEADVPLLRYDLAEEGTTLTAATITWKNPGGDDIVLAGQPLSGSLVWPGTVKDAGGKVVDWPGWTQQSDGTWLKGDSFDWVRGPVQVLFEVNPKTVAIVSYPATSTGCAPASSAVLAAEDVVRTTPAHSAVLAATGSDVGPIALAAGGLVVAGALILLVRMLQRRQAKRSTT